MKSHKPMFVEIVVVGPLAHTEYKTIVQFSQIRIIHESTREVELVNDDRYILTETSFQELAKTLLKKIMIRLKEKLII